MADGPRRSARLLKLNQNSDFVYDDDIWSLLNTGTAREENWQQGINSAPPSEAASPNVSVVEECEDNVFIDARSGWSQLEKLPYICSTISNSAIVHQRTCEVSEGSSRSVSLFQKQNTQWTVVSESVQCSPLVVNTQASWPRRSSTRFDFLDLDNNFLSVGSSSAISEMSDSEGSAQASGNKVCPLCKRGMQITVQFAISRVVIRWRAR